MRTKPRDAAGRRDGNRFGALLSVLVGVYVMSAFLSGYWVRALQVILFLVVVLIAMRTSQACARITRLASLIVLGGSLIAVALTLASPSGPVIGASLAWMALMLLFAVGLILRRVLAAAEVTLQSIFGAISAYMVIGLMFAACYGAMSKFSGTPFFTEGKAGSIETFQYFSFATLTTVGYGDFTAAAPSGRAVAVMEALLGQVFLATLVARLVSAYRVPGAVRADLKPNQGDEGDAGRPAQVRGD
jgi:hypothetical protein